MLLLPFSPLLIAEKIMTVEELITKTDLQSINSWGKKTQSTTLKDRMVNAFWNLKRDPELYNCLGKNCDETLVDVLYFIEALEENMGNCHSASVTVSLESAWHVNIPFLKSKLNYSYGYSYYALNGVIESSLSTSLLATKQFVGHNFIKRAKACESVTERAALGYAGFIKLFNTK